MELAPGADFQPQPKPPSIGVRQLTGRVSGLGGALATILGLSVALQVFVVLSPFFMQWVVDQVLVSADHDLLTLLGVVPLGVGVELDREELAQGVLVAEGGELDPPGREAGREQDVRRPAHQSSSSRVSAEPVRSW